MPINQELNLKLKEMWRIDEKLASGGVLNDEERIFYNTYLLVIQNYYREMNDHWKKKELVLSSSYYICESKLDKDDK